VTPLTSALLEGINNNDDEAFLGAEESVVAFKFGTGWLVEPYAQLLSTQPPQQADIDALKAALVAFVKREPSPNTGTAIFALGKFEDPALIPLFREQLALHTALILQQSSIIIQNLIIALDNHGEQIISGTGSGTLEIEKNLRDARIYLEKPTQKIYYV
jgi:hypothetical protein